MSKKPYSLALPFLKVSRTSATTLEDQVYRLLRDAIRRGVLKPGLRLPSSREMAAQAGVARNTVIAAMQRLTTEGFVHSHTGSGTYVAVVTAELLAPLRQSIRISQWGRTAASRNRRAPNPPRPVDDDSFPWNLWRELVASGWRHAQANPRDASGATGLYSLRAAIAEHVAVLRGIVCSADEVIITSSASEAVSAVTRLVVDPGDSVLMDSRAQPFDTLFRAQGLSCVEGSVDDEGLEIDEALSPAPRLVFLTPSCEGAAGTTMSPGRRYMVMEWAKKLGTAVIEYDFDVVADPTWEPVNAIKAIDSRGLVTFVGSFSTTLLPPVRIGFAIVPRAISEAFAQIDLFESVVPSEADQLALSLFIRNGHLARLIRRVKGLHDERRRLFVQELAKALPGTLLSIQPRVPLQLVLSLQASCDAVEIAAAASARGVEVAPMCEGSDPALVLSYKNVPLRQISDLVARLAAAFDDVSELRHDAPNEAAQSWCG